MSVLAITIYRGKSPGISKVCVCVMCYHRICPEKLPFPTPFHISSHLLLLLLSHLKKKIICSPMRLKTGKMHHLKATGSHSLPTYEAKVIGWLGLLEYSCLLYTCIIKNCYPIEPSPLPLSPPPPILPQRNSTRQERWMFRMVAGVIRIPFYRANGGMQCCPQSSSISSLLCCLLHVINHTYSMDSEL